MSEHDNPADLARWLKTQWSELERAYADLEKDEQRQRAVSRIEKIVQGYKEMADEGSIFKTVYGFEETVLQALEFLAAAYARVGQFDDAIVLHRYVAETVASIVRGRHRNRESLKDVRDDDLDHFSRTVGFLVYFSRHAAGQDRITHAQQLLNEAARLSNTWELETKRPEVH